MEPRVMAHSQAYRLKERMTEAEIRHGQEVRADLSGIRVTADAPGWRGAPEPQRGVIFFCTMGAIRVREVLASGDGQPLPSEDIVEGPVVPEPGTYDILNAFGPLQWRAPTSGGLRHADRAEGQTIRPGLAIGEGAGVGCGPREAARVSFQ